MKSYGKGLAYRLRRLIVQSTGTGLYPNSITGRAFQDTGFLRGGGFAWSTNIADTLVSFTICTSPVILIDATGDHHLKLRTSHKEDLKKNILLLFSSVGRSSRRVNITPPSTERSI